MDKLLFEHQQHIFHANMNKKMMRYDKEFGFNLDEHQVIFIYLQ